MKKIITLAVLVSSLAGCVTVPVSKPKTAAELAADAAREKAIKEAADYVQANNPIQIKGKDNCTDAWQRTEYALSKHSDGKIQTSTNTTIETYTINNYGIGSGSNASKLPAKDGCIIEVNRFFTLRGLATPNYPVTAMIVSFIIQDHKY